MDRKPYLINFLDDAAQRNYRRAVSAKTLDGAFMSLGVLVSFAALVAYSNEIGAGLVLSALITFNLVIFVLRFFVGRYAITRCYKLAFDASVALRRRVVMHLTELPLGAFCRLNPGRVAQTLSEDAMWLENEAAYFHSSSRAEYFVILFLFSGVTVLHWPAAIATLAFWTLGYLILRALRANLDRGLKFRSEGVAEAAKHFADYAEGMAVIRSVGASTAARQDFERWVNIMRSGFVGGIKRNTPLLGAIHAMSMAAVGVGALVIAITASENSDTLRPVSALALLLATLIPARAIMVNSMVTSIARRGELNAREILTSPPIQPGSAISTRGPLRVEMKNASFRYPSSQRGISGINFVAEPGTITAIVGPSGAGKTTLADLLLRFWDVENGEVLVDGDDIRSLESSSYMNRCAAVFQQTQLFEDSLKNNIRVGRPEATDKEVFAAAKAAQIHGTIMALPEQYDTVIAEGGKTLSGGERQRVTIARAILKNADIVILDEATSALDPENEREVQQAFEALAAGKTVFIIAHRLATVTHADQILVMENGRIVDQGTHEDLINASSVYKDLWSAHETTKCWKL